MTGGMAPHKSNMKTIIVSFAPEFLSLALNELSRHLGEIQSSPLARGIHTVHFHKPLKHLLHAWKKQPPIYIHHLFPVHKRLEVEAKAKDLLRQLRRVLRKTTLLRRLDKTKTFAAQVRAIDCYPSVTTDVVSGAIENLAHKMTKARVDVRSPEQVLSVLITKNGTWLGLSNVEENVSPWSGGGPPIPPDRGRLNRAEYKLIEALMSFDIALPIGGHTLDLGAGPGGWTRVLLNMGQKVTAVSPRSLVDELLHDERVQYHKLLAEEFLSQALNKGALFDFMTNDMFLVPQDSARLMVEFAPLLRDGGHAIVTLKLRCKDWRKVMSHTFRILRRAFIIPRIKHLFFNHREVTVWLKKNLKKSVSSTATELLK